MVDRIGLEAQLAMTGGVAKNSGVVEQIRSQLGMDANIPDEPQIVGPLGAALIAAAVAENSTIDRAVANGSGLERHLQASEHA